MAKTSRKVSARAEPKILTIIGQESEAKAADKLGPRQIDVIIRAVRAKRTKPK